MMRWKKTFFHNLSRDGAISIFSVSIALILSACGNEGSHDDNTVDDDDLVTYPTVILKTGQTLSHNEYTGEVIPDVVKDDGFYQTGTARSYTHDDVHDIVSDDVTALMWQDDARVTQRSWLTSDNYEGGDYYDTSGDTATTYCSDLTLGGHEDWRLPHIKELESLINYEGPLIDSVFNNARARDIWSSTTYAGDPKGVWVMRAGASFPSNKSASINNTVWCVRDRN